ncbi:MAG TPA: helix-turn-helix domain-containing protein [Candidatus Nanoarchaeia archaeon]|nr:helix-turn-helix domain-containing protein [Candidatus Nanoarchaeia archaeon]
MEEVLQQIGLSKGESKVYLALLKLGTVTVAKLKEETLLHRTTIYDFLEKLLNKGLASYVIQGGLKYFQAAKPAKLFDLLKEKQENLEGVLPELEKIGQIKQESIRVEVYRGIEGFKTLLNDILQTKERFDSIGIEESKFQEKFPFVMTHYFKKELKTGIKERVLARKGTKFVFTSPNIDYRYLPDEFFSPTLSGSYGNKVFNLIWDPLTIILIENKDLATSWKKYFEFMWKKAEKRK